MNSFSRNIDVTQLSDEVIDNALTMHANKDTLGQFRTHYKILQRQIKLNNDVIAKYRDDIKKILPDENFETTPATKTLSLSSEKNVIWSFSNKYHLYRPLESQLVSNANIRTEELIYSNRAQIDELHDISKKQLVSRFNYIRTTSKNIISFTDIRVKTIPNQPDTLGRVLLTQQFDLPVVAKDQDSGTGNQHVVFLVTICGRLKSFEQFLKRWGTVAQEDSKLGLFVSVFTSDAKETNQIIRTIKKTKAKYHGRSINYMMINGKFVRGQGLHEGISNINGSPIVFFCDVDMVFSQETVNKIRFNTRPGSVYFPIFFSQYAPPCDAELTIDEENGFWRIHSYGMVSMHVRDYFITDGFDLTIKGWGEEDLMFAESVIKSGLTVTRTFEETLLHPWHSKSCGSLQYDQYRDCKAIKMAHYCSFQFLKTEWIRQDTNEFKSNKIQLAEQIKQSRIRL